MVKFLKREYKDFKFSRDFDSLIISLLIIGGLIYGLINIIF